MWAFEEEQILLTNYGSLTRKGLADLLEKTCGAVKVKARELGLRKQVPDWSPRETEILVAEFSTHTLKELKCLLPLRSEGAIYNRANQLNLKRDSETIKRILTSRKTCVGMNRKYDINHHYFSNLDTPGKAYFLGLLWADGCIAGPSSVVINLKKTDAMILYLLKYHIRFSGPLHTRKYDNPNYEDAVVLQFTSKNIVDSLKKFNIVSRKSYLNKAPTGIPSNLTPHFIRGLFDGDGSFSIGSHSRYSVKIVNNESTCKWLLAYIRKTLGVGGSVRRIKNDTWAWEMGGRLQIRKFSTWLYTNSGSLFMERKYNKFIESGLLKCL